MAGTAALPSLSSSSIYRLNGILNSSSSTSKPTLPFFCFPIRRNGVSVSCQYLRTNRNNFHGINISTTRIRSAVEEETLVPETQEEEEAAPVSSEQPVSVPVSPSDMLTMFFQAEGTMNDPDVPKVISALEQVEGVSDLQVRIVESIATIELTKQTTVQATGVASNLVEVIQGSGFKLQTLNLSFKDEEDNE